MPGKEPTILVVGGGIAGMSAALHIAAAGHRALVVDEAPTIGGALPLLDKTYPTDSCGVCFLAPDPPALCPFLECEREDRIDIQASTILEKLEGDQGAFKATLKSGPKLVDPARCDCCGLCDEVCPETTAAGHLGAAWIGETRKAIYRPFPQSVPTTYVIDPDACTQCGKCIEVCTRGAIKLGGKPSTKVAEVCSVVFAPGFGPNDAHVRGSYGYGEYANVVSSLEYERMLSTSSPSHGAPVRPSDGEPAKRVAIIHCVGSRDRSCGVPYCSAVCCMIAAKQASLTKRRNPDSRVVVFTMDVRAAGRGYERYLAQIKGQEGVVYRRSLISGVKLNPESQDLLLEFAQEGRSEREVFDLVVLQVGMIVPPYVQELAKRSGIELNEHGFADTLASQPTVTSRPGVFVAGSFREPKDVVGTIAESIAAAAQALAIAGPAATEVAEDDGAGIVTPTFYDQPVIGVFFDGKDADLAAWLDLKALASEVERLADVRHVALKAADEDLRSAITKHNLTHVIIAGCSARSNGHGGGEFDGIPVTRVALGAEDALVHQAWPERAKHKALGLLRMAVEKARSTFAQPSELSMPEPRAVVIGGGISGMTAAKTLSGQGFEVHLCEKGEQLGDMGQLGQRVAPEWLSDLVGQVEADPLIMVHKTCELASFGCAPGKMLSTFATAEGQEQIAHGALILAIEAQEHRPDGFGLGESEHIITQAELGSRIMQWSQGEAPAKSLSSIVMVQCAGTREGQRLYCSMNCCDLALRNAIALKKLWPETKIAVLYRDIVTPGFGEMLYGEARDLGVLFLRYASGTQPQVKGNSVAVYDDVLGEEVTLEADLIVLSNGIVPGPGYASLAEKLGLGLDADGFFEPLNIKSQALDLPRPGMYLAGSAGGPATLQEAIAQGGAAGLRAALFLRRGIRTSLTVATVDERLCSGCGLCVEACPNDARSLDPVSETAAIDRWLCGGCGQCVAICPNQASGQAWYEGRGVLGAIEAALG